MVLDQRTIVHALVDGAVASVALNYISSGTAFAGDFMTLGRDAVVAGAAILVGEMTLGYLGY